MAGVVAAATVACASNDALRVVAPRVRHPVSLTGVVYGPRYVPLAAEHLVETGRFEARRALCNRAGLVDGAWDLSADLDTAIRAQGGEAVVGFNVEVVPPESERGARVASDCPTVIARGSVVRRRDPSPRW